jgi:DNA-binding GntR family transcriptional regulator
LEADGLIIVYPHRGAVIPTLSLTEITELFDLRALLECDQLARAIPCFGERDFARASAVLDEFEVILAGGRDVERWGESNWRFHSTLYAPAERPSSMQIIRDLHHRTDRYSRMQLLFTRWRQRADDEHRALLELCRRGDIPAARAFLETHILTAGQALVGFLEQQRGATADKPGHRPGGVQVVAA